MGQLQAAAWNIDSVLRFKVLPAGAHLPNANADKREASGNSGTGTINKTNHKETADRLDMPPPPSPASSTCSDTGSITTSHSKNLIRTFWNSFAYKFIRSHLSRLIRRQFSR